MPLTVAFDGTPSQTSSLRTALIVDDDPAGVRRSQRAARALGLEAAVVRSAEDALAWLETHAAPALCIVDLTLPRQSGFSLCERLREDRRTRHVPTLVTPGRKTVELHDEARALELEVTLVERSADLARAAGDAIGVAPRVSRFSVLAFLGA